MRLTLAAEVDLRLKRVLSVVSCQDVGGNRKCPICVNRKWHTLKLLDEVRCSTLLAKSMGTSDEPMHGWETYPYKEIIETRLEEFPRLSAKRLYDEIQAAGYTGGYGREGLRSGSAAVGVSGGGGAVRDAGGAAGAGGLRHVLASWGRRHALVMVLSHSRRLWLRFYRRQTMAVLIEGLESAFGLPLASGSLSVRCPLR